MKRFFNTSNKFFSGMNKLVNLLTLGFCAMIFSLPVVTIGAVGTAVYDTVHKFIIQDRGYLLGTFWESFKANFKKSTKIWLLQLVIGVAWFVDLRIGASISASEDGMSLLQMIAMIALLFLSVWVSYTCCYNARFEQTAMKAAKNAGLIAIANLPWSLLILAINILQFFVILIFPITLLFMPGFLNLMYHPVMERVFRKYMTPEEQEAENWKNTENE